MGKSLVCRLILLVFLNRRMRMIYVMYIRNLNELGETVIICLILISCQFLEIFLEHYQFEKLKQFLGKILNILHVMTIDHCQYLNSSIIIISL